MQLLIADDHDLVRETLAAFLKAEGDFEVTLTEDLHGAMSVMAGSTDPFDLVLLDFGMPGMDGLSGLARSLEANNGGRVAIMSGIAPKEVAQEAIDAGAMGFLPKTMGAKALVSAIRSMAMGDKYIPHDFLGAPEPASARARMAEVLTERELQILESLVRGLSNTEIAHELNLQEVTTRLHIKTLCRKIEAKNRTQAVILAQEAGLF